MTIRQLYSTAKSGVTRVWRCMRCSAPFAKRTVGSPNAHSSARAVQRPIMSEALGSDALSAETGRRSANKRPEDQMLIMICEYADGSGELRGVRKGDGVISFTPEKWQMVKCLVLRQI